MPRESLDAPEDLPKEAPRQLAFGKLEREVPRGPNQAPAECEEGLAIRPNPPVGSSPLDSSTRGRRVETILVVDDEDGVRSLVRDILEPRGYTILDTGDPRQALRIAREHPTPIDLFLIDVMMPLMKGTELALKVEALRPQAKILLMSAYMLSEVTATGRPFLAKPFGLNGLATKVRAVLDGHSPFGRTNPGPRPS